MGHISDHIFIIKREAYCPSSESHQQLQLDDRKIKNDLSKFQNQTRRSEAASAILSMHGALWVTEISLSSTGKPTSRHWKARASSKQKASSNSSSFYGKHRSDLSNSKAKPIEASPVIKSVSGRKATSKAWKYCRQLLF